MGRIEAYHQQLVLAQLSGRLQRSLPTEPQQNYQPQPNKTPGTIPGKNRGIMIDGTYKIQMDSPVGAKEGTAVLITSGEKLTGSLTAMGVQIDIENGKVTDNSFTFGGKLESFVGPVIFAVGGSVEGDTIQGIAHIANRDFVFTGYRS